MFAIFEVQRSLFPELLMINSYQQIPKLSPYKIVHIVSECRSADSADINDKIIRFSAVQMSKILDNSRNPKVLLRENADLLILLISTINIQHFLLFKC